MNIYDEISKILTPRELAIFNNLPDAERKVRILKYRLSKYGRAHSNLEDN